jgi:hypothetical protein
MRLRHSGRFLETAFAVTLACAVAAMGPPAAAAPGATLRASTVQGTLTIQGSITVDNSYDGRVNCGDGVRSDQSVTVHLSLKPRRIIIASALGAASGTVMSGTSSVTIGQNSFEYSPPSCNGEPGVAFGEAPTAPICEPSQGKAMIMLTQNPPPGTLEPVPLVYPRLHLVVSAADNRRTERRLPAVLAATRLRRWRDHRAQPGGVTSVVDVSAQRPSGEGRDGSGKGPQGRKDPSRHQCDGAVRGHGRHRVTGSLTA